MIKAYSNDIDLWLIYNDETILIEGGYNNDPRTCDITKDYYHDVMNVDGIKRISFNEVETLKQKTIILFIFGELKCRE